MKGILIIFTIIFSSAGSLFAQDHAAAISALMRKANIPGLSLAYVKNGTVQEKYAMGVTSAETGVPVNDSTVFSACSLGKSVFSYAIFRLCQEHLLDIDKPLWQYFDYKDIDNDPKYKLVTARMVLTHSSGLPNWRDDALYFKYAPGERFSYSGEGFVWLSKVAEKITGKGIEELVQEKVFKPLGMRHTSYIWQPTVFGDNFAYPHIDVARTMGKQFPAESNVAQSMQTTASDYAKFLITVMKDRKFISVLAADKGVAVSKGITWRDGFGYEETNQGPAFWQWGDNGTFKAFMIAYPGKQEGMVYFTNTFLGLRIARDLLKLYFSSDQPALDWLHIDSADAPDLQVFLHAQTMRVEEAMAPYYTPGKKSPDTALLNEAKMNYLGNRYTQLGQYEKARVFLEMNLLNYPSSAGAWRNLGEMYMRAGDPKKSAVAWRKAYALDQQYPHPKIIADRLEGIPEPRDTSKRIVHIKLGGYLGAHFVAIAGSFNNWNDGIQPLCWINGEWTTDLQVKPGIYRYKFVVDGVYIPDPSNPNLNKESFDSIMEVK